MQVATPKKGYKLVKTSFGKYEEIPEEWELTDLEAIFSIKQGKYFDEQLTSKGTYPVYGANGIISHTDKIMYKERVVLVSCRGANCGVVHLTQKSSWVNNNSMVLIPKNTKFDLEFFYFLLRNTKFDDVISGSAQPQIIVSTLNKKRIFYTRSINEQKQIASILSNVDDTIQKTDQIIQQTQRLKKGMMQKLLTRGIGHTKFKKTKIGEIPEDWKIIPLKEVGEWNGGGTPSKSNKTFWTNGSIPWISPKDMKNPEIYDSIDKITPKAIEKSVGKIIKSNSILFVVRSGILQKKLPVAITRVDVTINQDMKALTVGKESNPSYMFHAVRLFSEDIRNSCSKGGTTVQSIVVPQLLEYPIPLPPFQEQKQITSILSNMDTQIQKEKLHKSNLERLKKGLMQKLLTGQIRVMVS